MTVEAFQVAVGVAGQTAVGAQSLPAQGALEHLLARMGQHVPAARRWWSW